MHAAIQSRARLTLHAIERHSALLIAALDAALVELSPECVRWGAVCDPQPWIVRAPRMPHGERSALRLAIAEAARTYTASARELEALIVNGATSRDCEFKAQIRDEVQTAADSLGELLRRWIETDSADAPSPEHGSAPFPQYVPRAVPRMGEDDRFFSANVRTSA